MSNNIRDEFYINYYMSNRVMRKTNNPDILHKIYSAKYANWIIPFLNQHSIKNVPSLLCCNTLHLFPDFFTLRNHSFFVSDYYLYSYFYDFNYAFSTTNREEYFIDLLIKAFIECAFLAGNIDLSYSLAQTSPDIEAFKESDDYKNVDTMTSLIDKTDLQEAFTFLHEATHYLCRKEPDHLADKIACTMAQFGNIEILGFSSEILEECYCDFNSVTFILETTYSLNEWGKSEYFEVLFLVLIYTYILEFARAVQCISLNEYSHYMNKQMELLCLRLGGIYAYILRYLHMSGHDSDIPALNTAYQKCIETFKSLGYKARTILEYVKIEGDGNFHLFDSICREEKDSFVKSYLKLMI